MSEGSADTVSHTLYHIDNSTSLDTAMLVPAREGQVGWAAWLSFPGAEPGKQSHGEMRVAGRRDVTGGVRSTPEVLQVQVSTGRVVVRGSS